MKVDTYKCDGCGTQKGELNHWFIGCFDKDGIMFCPWNVDNIYRAILPARPNEFPDLRPERHYCSDACVIKAVQFWLSEQQKGSVKSNASSPEALADLPT